MTAARQSDRHLPSMQTRGRKDHHYPDLLRTARDADLSRLASRLGVETSYGDQVLGGHIEGYGDLPLRAHLRR
jgi:hypothetical protein